MSRISTQIARLVAKQLLEAKRTEIKELKDSLNQKAYEVHLSNVPSVVLDVFKKHSSYFNKRNGMQLSGPGLGYQHVSFNVYVPVINQYLTLEDKQAGDFQKLINKINSKEAKVQLLEDDIVNALVGLRTYKNIESNFPEAFKLLPKITTSTGLAINFSDLRAQIA